jgi:FMN reductase
VGHSCGACDPSGVGIVPTGAVPVTGAVVSVAVVVGNPRADSRTLRVALATADALSVAGDPSDRLVIDLAEVAGDLFDHDSVVMPSLLAAVADSDLVIVASPTYKATYTGILKAFLDRYSNDALAHTVAIAVMTGAAPIHALAPEVHLRPLLVELGATVPTRGLYVTEQQFDDLDAVIGAWAATARPLVERALS